MDRIKKLVVIPFELEKELYKGKVKKKVVEKVPKVKKEAVIVAVNQKKWKRLK